MRTPDKIRVGGGSKLLALVFFVITLFGMVLIFAPKSAPDMTDNTSSTAVSSPATFGSDHSQQKSISLTGYIWKVVLITAVILGLFWLLAKFYRQKMMSGISSGTRFTILGREYLSPNSSLVMVHVENRKLLLGITDAAVNLISEFEIRDADELEKTLQNPKDNPFQILLKNFTGKSGESEDKS